MKFCRGGRIHTRWGCREVLYEEAANGETEVTGLRLTRAGVEHIAKADVYVAALDVPGGLCSVSGIHTGESRRHQRVYVEVIEGCIGRTGVQ